MLNGLKYVYMNQNRFSERIGASWRPETSFGGLGGQKRVNKVYFTANPMCDEFFVCSPIVIEIISIWVEIARILRYHLLGFGIFNALLRPRPFR